MRPTKKELAAARKVFGPNVEEHYEKSGLAVLNGGWELTRLGCLAFACGRFVEGERDLGLKQPRSVQDWMSALVTSGYIRDVGASSEAAELTKTINYRLTKAGQHLAASTGLAPQYLPQVEIPAPARSGVQLVSKKRAA